MRDSEEERIGRLGEDEIVVQLGGLGWPAVRVDRGDLGTDVLAQVRDARRFDLGLILGFQVKTGDGWFKKKKEKRTKAGELIGWWYTEADVKHVDAWIGHGFPHVLVLHRLGGASYWVHVRKDLVKRTGRGVKILVPVNQQLDPATRVALIEAAARQRLRSTFDGSAWDAGASAAAPGAAIRHALLAPQLIAPHPNAGFSRVITSEEALALVVRARLSDLDTFRERHAAVPVSADCLTHKDWRWRFVGAVERVLVEGDNSQLDAVCSSADQPHRRAAAAAVGCALLFAAEDHQRALALLDEVPDDCGPIDHAWLLAHRARVLGEAGRANEAKDAALQALRGVATVVDDATASAIRAAAAGTLFRFARWNDEDLASAVTAADNPVAWWRSQGLTSALSEGLERTFHLRMRSTTRRHGQAENAHNAVLSASLTAGLAADHSAWRSTTQLLAKNTLVAELDDVDKTALALDELRRSGDPDAVLLAGRQIWEAGPLEALQRALASVGENSWTRTPARANLSLIQRGGDLLDESDADRLALRILDMVADPEPFTRRVNPTFAVRHYAGRALVALLPAASGPVLDAVADLISSQAPVEETEPVTWVRLAAGLRHDRLSSPAADRLAAAGTACGPGDLAVILLETARSSPLAMNEMNRRAAGGDRVAAQTMNDPVRLPVEVVRSWVEEDAQLIRTEMAEAEQGSYTDRPNAVESMVWLGAALPDLVDWEPLLDLLAHPLVRSRTKRRLCFRLARAAPGLPSVVTERLRELVPSIVGSPADRHLVDTMGGAIAHLAITLNVDGLFDTQSELLGLLGAETQSRADAAIMIGLHPAAAPLVPVLLALVHDDRQEIRAASATGLAHHLIRTPDSPHPAALPALTAAVASGGGQPALDVVSTFAGAAHVPGSCGDLLGSLSEHPSARVRNIVVGLVDREDGANPPDSSAR